MDPYTIVKDENLEIYDEFAKVKQEITNDSCTFQLPNVQEDVKFSPETTLLDKLTVSSSTTHQGIDGSSCNYVTHIIDNIRKNLENRLKSKEENSQKFECDVYEKNRLAIKEFSCDTFSHATNYKTQLTVQVNGHSKVKDFKCELCDFATNNRRNLTSHSIVHSNVKKFQCELCEYTTKRKICLKRHMQKHANLKNFRCHMCDYASNLKSCLILHVRNHSAVKEFSCDNCSYATNRKDRFADHVKKHFKSVEIHSKRVKHLKHRQKSYDTLDLKCNLCGYTSNNESYFKKEITNHSNLKNFLCHMCDYAKNFKGNV